MAKNTYDRWSGNVYYADDHLVSCYTLDASHNLLVTSRLLGWPDHGLSNSLKWALWQHSRKLSYLSSVCPETSLHLEKVLPQCACIQSLKPVSVKICRVNVDMISFQVMPYSWKLSTTLSNNEASESYKEAIDPAVTVPLCCFSMLLCFISMLSLSTVSKPDGSV